MNERCKDKGMFALTGGAPNLSPVGGIRNGHGGGERGGGRLERVEGKAGLAAKRVSRVGRVHGASLFGLFRADCFGGEIVAYNGV